MTVLHVAVLVLVAAGGLGVVLTRNPLHQAIVLSLYGSLLSILFVVFQAPEVALSQIVVGTIGVPLMILLTLAKVRDEALQQRRKKEKDQDEDGEEGQDEEDRRE